MSSIKTILGVLAMLLLMGVTSCTRNKPNNDSQSTNQSSTPVELTSWEDSLAYALGMQYARERELGYSKSLKEYLSGECEMTFGTDAYSEVFGLMAQRGCDDKQNGRAILSPTFVQDFLNIVHCESRILKYEREIPTETNSETANRMHISMNNEYKRLQTLLQSKQVDSYTHRIIENYEHKRDSILALAPEMFVRPKSTNSSSTQQPEPPRLSIGKWELKDGQYVSPLFYEAIDKGCSAQFILAKGKVMIKFSEKIEAENEMKISVNGREETLKGSRSGNTFTISSQDTHSILLAMENGNFTFQYMFLEAGASHWEWYDFKIGNQLKQATQAFNAINR